MEIGVMETMRREVGGGWAQHQDSSSISSHPTKAPETPGLLISAPSKTQCPNKVPSVRICIFLLTNCIILILCFWGAWGIWTGWVNDTITQHKVMEKARFAVLMKLGPALLLPLSHTKPLPELSHTVTNIAPLPTRGPLFSFLVSLVWSLNSFFL